MSVGNLITGSMFSGIGLLDFGLHIAGLQHVWFAERDEYRRGILARRWPGAQILDDVRSVRAGVVPRVDVLAGGFPCKGVSGAGLQNGFDHPETVLWREMRRAIGELRPRYVAIENVANLLSMARAPGEPAGSAWGEVLADLAAFGFVVRWDSLPAAAFGAPHLRDRVFAVAAHPGGRGWGAVERDVRAGEQNAPRASDRSLADADGAGGTVVGIGTGRGIGRAGRRDEPEAGSRSAADASCERWDTASRVDGERGLGQAVGAGRDRAAEAAADADRAGREELDRTAEPVRAQLDGAPRARGVAVEWGEYGPAVRRGWEPIHGPAPEPLVRRVDDGRTSRLERSRLSALGDGVLVHAGWCVGRWIAAHAADAESLERAA